jgi:hypothetical protein
MLQYNIIQWEQNQHTRDLVEHTGFSFVRLHTQSVTYPLRCFIQTVRSLPYPVAKAHSECGNEVMTYE